MNPIPSRIARDRTPRTPAFAAAWALSAGTLFMGTAQAQDASAVPLPPGVQAVWDMTRAHRETTPTRERICLNGLWRWQPAGEPNDPTSPVPVNRWGYFKVPGSWPGITDYMQKDSQTVLVHPAWQAVRLANVRTAWYEREIQVPPHWAGQRFVLSVEYLNSHAAVFVDGRPAGEIQFPAGELDLTPVLRPGVTHRLGLRVTALPLKEVLQSYTDSAAAREVTGSVPRRGLCGDVFLVGEPPGPRLGEIRVATSVRHGRITFGATITNLSESDRYVLRARVRIAGAAPREFESPTFAIGQLREGRFEFTSAWRPDRLWDLHTPQNIHEVDLSLASASPNGRVHDVHWPARFGFRELWIDGRDFILNGTRLHLSAVPLDNAQVGAALSTYSAARESLERLQTFGINFVYTHNYDCEPGSHLSFAEILRAADDVGMLVALTQPHFSHYDWKAPAADAGNGYARHAAFYVQAAGNHPSVVMYAMSHNATGYEEDMNPDLIDGRRDVRDTWSARNAKLALRAEAIVQRLDPHRIIYHHASGHLGAMHSINFYPNFVPIQELSDWFGPWSAQGIKPLFLCEYGAPFTWDWTMYRGWYQGQREFGSAKVPWEFCLAEWNAQFVGDAAYAISEAEKANLRWEARQFRTGQRWHRWDYPHPVGSSRFTERYPVFERYLTANWRAFRTWGVSAISPWEYEHFWTTRPGLDRRRRDLPVDWASLQRPGFSPDYEDQRYERMDLAFERSDWVATPAANALNQNNRPLLAYIAGPADRFTSHDHNYRPGDTAEKQLIIINDSREPVTGHAEWTLALPVPVRGRHSFTVAPGQQERHPLTLPLPATLPPGTYTLTARFALGAHGSPADTFSLHVLPPPPDVRMRSRVALWDPQGQTGKLLQRLGVTFENVQADTDLSGYDTLLVGRRALTLDGSAPSLARVREGLRVLMFEQSAAVLEQRLGFRVAEYGLRQVFPRVPDHPALAGLLPEHCQDWRGDATLLPPRLDYTLRPRHGPTVTWCGLPVSRLWRCGNRGNVASVSIEKPACGDFLPILDGGYALQYSPLLEYHEGRGLLVFCQLDVTDRTNHDPAADRLVGNLLRHVDAWQPRPSRPAVYVGDPAGRRHLESAGFAVRSRRPGESLDGVLVMGAGGGAELAPERNAVATWLKDGGHLLALGVGSADTETLLPDRVVLRTNEHIAASFAPPSARSPFAGIAPADLHNRDPRALPQVAAGAISLGNGILAASTNSQTVFCQMVPWQFGPSPQANLRKTHRRSSVALARLLANLGVASRTPLLDRFASPPGTAGEQRWLKGFYLDTPEEWDDPYRFFRW